jgi:hypothetical protein
LFPGVAVVRPFVLAILLCGANQKIVAQLVPNAEASFAPAVSEKSGNSSANTLSDDLWKLQKCLSDSSDLQRLSSGLLHGYSGHGSWFAAAPHGPLFGKVPPPPAAYMASLERDIAACQYARTEADPSVGAQVMDLVREDITVKADDCAMFGMGRMVPVRIMTMHAGSQVDGWAAFYKWSSVSSLPVQEMRAPGLTSHQASISLPPGVYTFRAELQAADMSVKKTDSVTVPVGNRNTVDVQLQVP